METKSDWEEKYLKAGQPLWDPFFVQMDHEVIGQGPALQRATSYGESSRRSTRSILFERLPFLPHTPICTAAQLWAPEAPGPFSGTQPTPKSGAHTQDVKSITDFSSLSKTNPILAITFAIILFSNAGIPPLAGFYGKLNVFLAAVEGSMFFLAISGICCSAAGAFYSIRLIKIAYFHKLALRAWHRYKPLSKESSLMLGLTFFFTLFFFLYPSFLFITTHSAALSLCLHPVGGPF